MCCRIKMFSSFCSSNHCKRSIEELIISQSTTCYGNTSNNSVYIVDENDENYTHIVIWNTAMPIIPDRIPKKNVIGFSLEPLVYLNITDKFVEYARRHIQKYYIGDTCGLGLPFIEGNCFLTYAPPLFMNTTMLFKTACMSIVLSNKNQLSGHQYRRNLVEYILYHKLPIDIYGNGCIKHRYKDYKSQYIKGPFQRYEPYNNYLFSICIENTRSNHYFSEKIINPLLTNTTPIYLGCNNIDNYFSSNIIHLTGNITADMNLLTDILRFPCKYYKKIDPIEIERKVSFFQNINNVYNEDDKQVYVS